MKSNHKPGFPIAVGSRRGRWNKLSPLQRIGTVFATFIQVSLLVAALVDLRRQTRRQIRGNKRLWTLVVFINWIGPISYFLFGRLRPEKSDQPMTLTRCGRSLTEPPAVIGL